MLQLSFVNFKRGSYILIEGKADTDRFYNVQSGQVQIAKQKEVVAEEEGNLLGPGDFLGVVACMDVILVLELSKVRFDFRLFSLFFPVKNLSHFILF